MRKHHQKVIEVAQKGIEKTQADFGDEIIETYPKLLISRAIFEAQNILKLKINSTKLPLGITKTLINYLISEENKEATCICGNPLCESERKHIEDFLNLLPPKSYTSIYQEFISTAKKWGKEFDESKLNELILMLSNNIELVEENEEEIRRLDTEQKKSPDIEELVADAEGELKKANILLKKQMKEYDELSQDDIKTQDALRRIEIMKSVLADFEERLENASNTYSRKLEKNIQELLNAMMDNDRRVSVSSDFAVKVVDKYGDEAKSEGQFAITSFAYIAGIFKMLRSEEHLADKEYPLVLDGPFSKLDPGKIQSVVDVIPQFAPQVILFSKDSLQNTFEEEQIGRVWTIVSNSSQNVAKMKEGYLWN